MAAIPRQPDNRKPAGRTFQQHRTERSPYYRINTTYGDNSANVSGNVVLIKSTTDNYSQGKRLSDSG